MALQYPDSWTAIANLALARLPAKRIVSVDPPDAGNPIARSCADHLPLAIEEVLTHHDWIGMTRRVSLEKSADTPAFGYSYFYQLPADVQRLLSVDAEKMPFRREQDQIATDATTVKIAYIFRPMAADVSVIPLPIRMAIISALAYLLSTPQTSSEDKAKRLDKEKTRAFNAAVASDGAGKEEDTLENQIGVTWHDEAR